MTTTIDLAIEHTELKIAAAKVIADWKATQRMHPKRAVKWASLSALEKILNDGEVERIG